jgi:sorbitol-specific phosphotransferase system component IIBC
MRAATATLFKRGGGGTLLAMPTVSPTPQPAHSLTPLTRIELAVGLLGAICGVIGFPLGSHVLEYIAVLASVSGVSLLTARALRG